MVKLYEYLLVVLDVATNTLVDPEDVPVPNVTVVCAMVFMHKLIDSIIKMQGMSFLMTRRWFEYWEMEVNVNKGISKSV